MRRNKLAFVMFTILTSLTLSVITVQVVAQTANGQLIFENFENSKVTLRDLGKKDTLGVIDPVTGDILLKILPILYPIQVNGSVTVAERSPYPISALMQKKLGREICNSKDLKSMFNGKPLPDGVITLGLTNIVMTPYGTVAYYTLYATRYYMEKEKVSRTIDLEKELTRIFKEGQALFKQKFKEPYLVLTGNRTTMKFRVHNGTIKVANGK